MSTVITADPRIDRADRLLTEYGDEARWPKGREAVSALTWARDSLIEALDAHVRTLGPYTPNCEEQDAAIEAAAITVEDTATHLQKVHAEYVRREEAARGNAA